MHQKIFYSTIRAKNWSVKNSTKLAKITLSTGVTWDGISDDSEIVKQANTVTTMKASLLAVGDIIAFKTAAGKMGLIKVTAITETTGADTITYGVKMQQ